MYSYKVEQAIRAASVLHENQLRKGAVPLPYISHLVAVALIISDYTQDEDTVVAGLLHDTLEDTDYTLAELQEDFGGPVAEIVLALTEPRVDSHGARLPWLENKKAYAKQLKGASEKALIVAAADKIHNFRSFVEEYYDDYKRFTHDFGPHQSDRMEAYQTIANTINSRLKSKILQEFNHTFNEFKQFLVKVEEAQNKW